MAFLDYMPFSPPVNVKLGMSNWEWVRLTPGVQDINLKQMRMASATECAARIDISSGGGLTKSLFSSCLRAKM